MCGICGKLLFDNSARVDPTEFQSMIDSLVHRGPDDQGSYTNNNVSLGFRRLSIIDLVTGNQPLSNEDKTIWIVFNGEIYNYLELKNDLINRGHKFRTETDTEVIVHLYEEYGESSVQKLRGMFSFAIWDNRKKQLFCARDRFGIKPFYYYLAHDSFVFGSEIKAILNSRGFRKKIDPLALDSYFTYGYIMGEHSIFQEIKKLLPGHTLTIDVNKSNKPIIKKYWEINFEPEYDKSEKQWEQEFDSIFSESVSMRLMSDVPLGAFLSGGIDSSSVVAMMSRHSSEPVKTFSIGFENEEQSELAFAREIANKYKTEHHEKIVEPSSIDLLSKIVDIYDEPFADSSAIPTYIVSKFAREYVTVVLSGDGGDELFAGYDSYSRLKKFSNAPSSKIIRRQLWNNLSRHLPYGISGKGSAYYLSKNINDLPAFLSRFNSIDKEQLYSGTMLENISLDKSEKYKLNILRNSSGTDLISRAQDLDMKTYLVDDILTKVDRASMINSLEVRVPLLDHKLAELTFKIPVNLKLNNSGGKYIFKKAMSRFLPPQILTNKKQGFGLPLNAWFREDLQDYVNSRFESNNNSLYDLVNKAHVKKIIDSHFQGMRDSSTKIWSLLFLDAWLLKNT